MPHFEDFKVRETILDLKLWDKAPFGFILKLLKRGKPF